MLCHYTTPAGLKGIIETKKLWASDFRFLNDSSEVKYGLDLVKDYLTETSAEQRDRFPDVIWDIMQNYLKKTTLSYPGIFINDSLMVISLTKERDLLSLWRGYNNASGFIVEFDEESIQKCADRQGFILGPVDYILESQKNRISMHFNDLDIIFKGISEKIIAIRNNDYRQTLEVLGIIEKWWSDIIKSVGFFKNPAFSEEKEYRLVKISRSWPNDMKLRLSPAGLVPYIEFDLISGAPTTANLPNSIGITGLTVGPGLNATQEIAADALLRVARIHIRSPGIQRSILPYIP